MQSADIEQVKWALMAAYVTDSFNAFDKFVDAMTSPGVNEGRVSGRASSVREQPTVDGMHVLSGLLQPIWWLFRASSRMYIMPLYYIIDWGDLSLKCSVT